MEYMINSGGMLDLSLLEQNPIFIPDTNALSKIPPDLIQVFDFRCPQGVVREVERWEELVESLPGQMAELEGEIAEAEQVLRIKEWLEEAKREEEYPRVSELVEGIFLGERLDELSSKRGIEEWEEAVKLEGKNISDELSRERRNYNLQVAKSSLTWALSGRIRIEAKEEPKELEEYLGGRNDLKAISAWCRKAAEKLGIFFEEGEGFILLGQGEEREIPFFSYRHLREKEGESEGKRKELRRMKSEYEKLQRQGEERRNALAIIQELRSRGKIIPPKKDWVTSSLHSCTGTLSKTIARDVLKEHAHSLSGGEKSAHLVEKGLEIYRRRAVRGFEEGYEERLKGKLKSHLSQLLERIEREKPEKEVEAFISSLAEEFQNEEGLRVDVEVLRASFQMSSEFPGEMIFIVTGDSDLIDLFLLSRELRSRLFPNVKYCEIQALEEFSSRLRQARAKLNGLEDSPTT